MKNFEPDGKFPALMRKVLPYAIFTAWASLIAIFVVKSHPETAKYFAEAIGLSAFTCYFEALKSVISDDTNENRNDHAFLFSRMAIDLLLALMALALFWAIVFNGLIWPIKYLFNKALGNRANPT